MIWHISIDSDLRENIGRFPRGSRTLERSVRDFGIRNADSIIAQTREQKRLLRAKYGRNAQVIRNFQPQPSQNVAKADRPTVIWVANLKPAKRPEAFLKVVKQVSKSLRIRFVMVGRGGHAGSNADMIEEASRTADLLYIGEKPISEVNELISSAHILVNTSIDEGFPNTFIQAWYRHTVVVTLGIDPDSVLTGQSCGFVCGTVEEIVNVIEQLVKDRELRARVAKQAFRYVTDAHSLGNAHVLAKTLVDNP
jgi:glycosyltransferase involved in cell wall biosynthesis